MYLCVCEFDVLFERAIYFNWDFNVFHNLNFGYVKFLIHELIVP